jgi:perosamine synthetase
MRHISLGTLNISDKGKEYVNDCLNNNRLSKGKYTEKFESKFARMHGCKHGIFTNSGTSALQIALAALKEIYEYKDGDEVLVPATTFIATSNVVLQNGLRPIFVDVDPKTFNLDVSQIARHLTPRTRCIIPVHLFGLPCDMSGIMTYARGAGLQVLEDSCETVGATQYGRSVGSFGDAACFSNYIAHHVTGGIGGLVTTKDARIAEICRSLMCHGRDNIYLNIDQDDNADERLLKAMIERRYSFERIGFSYRCTEIEAAISLSELERIEENLRIRRANAEKLTSLLSPLKKHLQLPMVPSGHTHSWMMYPIVLASDINRHNFLLFLEQRGIETRLLFPLLETPIYKKIFPGLAEQYPVAQKLAAQGAFIGMHQGLTSDDINYVSAVIHEYFSK